MNKRSIFPLTILLCLGAAEASADEPQKLERWPDYQVCQSLDPVTAEHLCGPEGVLSPAPMGFRPQRDDRRFPLHRKRTEDEGLFKMQDHGSFASPLLTYFFSQVEAWLPDTVQVMTPFANRLGGYPAINEECFGFLDMISTGKHPNEDAPSLNILVPEREGEDIELTLAEVQQQFPNLQLAGIPFHDPLRGRGVFDTMRTEAYLNCDIQLRPGEELLKEAYKCPVVQEKVDRYAAVYRLPSWLGEGKDAFLLYLEDDCTDNDREFGGCVYSYPSRTKHRTPEVQAQLAYVGDNWNTAKLYFNPALRVHGLGRIGDRAQEEPSAEMPHFGSMLLFEFNTDVYVLHLTTMNTDMYRKHGALVEEDETLARLGYPNQERPATSLLKVYRYGRGAATPKPLCDYHFLKHQPIQ